MRNDQERHDLVASYLRYLEHVRMPDDESEAAMAELRERSENNPHDEAWDELYAAVSDQPEDAWPIVLDVLDRCDERDLPMVGAGVLERLLWLHPQKFVDRFESQIRSSRRFFAAFQYVGMTGVPLAIQRRLNATLIDRGADPRFVVEYDEQPDEAET